VGAILYFLGGFLSFYGGIFVFSGLVFNFILFLFFHKNVSTLSQQLTPKITKYLSPYNITKIAAGDNHTAALDCKLVLEDLD
jgi:hypothetical protein